MTRPPVGDLVDARRTEPAFVLTEREMLDGWLEFHRTTLLLKCEGVDPSDLKRQPISTSKLSLQGLVRHMAEVERGWFRRCFLREPGLPYIYYESDADEDLEFEPLDHASWPEDLATWQEECTESRRAVAGRTLDDTGLRRGIEVSLRWILTHMIEEYARHNGHADLIREMVDGRVGC